MIGDQNFAFLCIDCQKHQRVGATSHEYTILFEEKGRLKGTLRGLKITYLCFTCGAKEVKILDLKNKDDQSPANREEFMKRNKGAIHNLAPIKES